ncbi:MAG: extracellular solute-binding protein [Eubacteriales bacterium]|nr:extracellular solute-binding protein [Eubacteriales bacterium]
MKKRFLAAAALSGICFLLSGCGEEENVSIRVKVPVLTMNTVVDPDADSADKFLRKAAEAFEAQNEGVTIHISTFEQTKEDEAVTDCFDTETAADVLYEGYFNMATYIYTGRMVPLDDIISDEMRDDIDSSLWDMSQVEGRTYMIPFLSLQNTYVYNKDLFRQAGLEKYLTEQEVIQNWDLDQWDEILASLKENLPENTYVMPMYAKNSQGDTHTMTLIRSNGSSFFDDDRKIRLNTEEGIAGLQWISDNAEKGYYPPYCEDLEISDTAELFYNEQCAFMVGNNANSSGIPFDYGVVNFPGGEGGYATAFVTGFSVFDNGDDQKLEKAMEFVKFICETETWRDYSAGAIPASKKTADKYKNQIPRLEEYYQNNVNVVDFTANNPNWRGVREAFYPHIQKLLQGDESPAEAAAGIDQDCNAAIEEGLRTGKLHE